MKKILVMSKREVSNFKSNKPYAVISFRDPGENVSFQDDDNRLGVLPLGVQDVNDKNLAKLYNLRRFTEEDGDKVLDFVEKYKNDIEILVVHCHAGVSRSSGCGAAIQYIYFNKCTDILNNTNLYVPNKLIYCTILNCANRRNIL